jgi:hypothetical protein
LRKHFTHRHFALNNNNRIDNNTTMAQQPVFWKKRVLVPFWVVRICVMLLIIAVYAWTLRNLGEFAEIERPGVA